MKKETAFYRKTGPGFNLLALRSACAVITASLLLLLSSCSMSGDSTAAPTNVRGWVAVNGLVQNSTVAFYDTSGNELPLAEQSTPVKISENGTFLAAVPNLPSDFRVEVRDVTGDTISTPATLKVDVHNYNPGAVVYVNAVTTLSSAYRDRNPNMSATQATAAVLGFLNLPDGLSDGALLQSSARYFSHTWNDNLAKLAAINLSQPPKIDDKWRLPTSDECVDMLFGYVKTSLQPEPVIYLADIGGLSWPWLENPARGLYFGAFMMAGDRIYTGFDPRRLQANDWVGYKGPAVEGWWALLPVRSLAEGERYHY